MPTPTSLKRKRVEVSSSISLFTNYVSEENSTSTPAATFEGQFVRCTQYEVVAISVFCSEPCTLDLMWSFDGNAAVNTLTYAIAANTLDFKRFQIQAPYVGIYFATTPANTVPASLDIYTVLDKKGLNVGDIPPTTIVPVTDDIQVTQAPAGQWNVDIGHSTNATADSMIFGGQADYSTSNLGAATGSVVLGEGTTALDFTAAQYATSVGYDAGRTPAGINTTAVGNSAGKIAQGASGISIGYQAGMTSQGTQSVAIGEGAGMINQGPTNVAIGYAAGQTNQTFGSTFNASVAIGYAAASSNQGQMSVAIGPNAASTSQSAEAVAVGRFSGNQNQGLYCVAVGDTAGQYNQKAGGVAIGANSGRGLPGTSFQAGYSVAVGYGAASNGQGSNAVAIGVNAAKGSPDGTNLQGDNAVAIGNTAGQIAQGTYAVAMGYQAGQTNQGPNNVAIGYLAGQTNQTAGTDFHGSVAIGIGAAQTSQKQLSVAIGANAGNTTQGEQCVAIGRATAEVTQGNYSVAIGSGAGRYNQKTFSVAIGIAAAAGVSSLVGYQDVNSVAIGAGCAQYGQGSNAIAIGAYASQGAVDGSTPQPANSVAIGANCARPGNTGRLAFGNAMEGVTAIGANHQHLAALINLEWNGVHYRIPALSSTATDLHTTMDPMAIGELWYADATGFTTTNLNTAGGILLAPGTTLMTTSSLSGGAYFDEPVDGRLRYLGTSTKTFHGAVSLCASCPNTNQALSFFVKKNGITASKSIYYFTTPSGGNNFTVAAHAVFSLATNDYVEIWAENTTANNQITIKNLNLVIMGDGGMV